MRDATKTLILAGLAAGLAACGGEGSQDQNFAIDNVGAGAAEVEALPADESSATPTNALVNGTADDLDVPTADNQTDSY